MYQGESNPSKTFPLVSKRYFTSLLSYYEYDTISLSGDNTPKCISNRLYLTELPSDYVSYVSTFILYLNLIHMYHFDRTLRIWLYRIRNPAMQCYYFFCFKNRHCRKYRYPTKKPPRVRFDRVHLPSGPPPG